MMKVRSNHELRLHLMVRLCIDQESYCCSAMSYETDHHHTTGRPYFVCTLRMMEVKRIADHGL